MIGFDGVDDFILDFTEDDLFSQTPMATRDLCDITMCS